MAKKEDFKTREERVEEGKAIVDMFKGIMGDKDLLNALTHADDEEDDIDPEVEQKLLKTIRQLTSEKHSGLQESLQCFENIRQLFLETIWADEEPDPDELVIADLLSNIEFLQAQPFAPWMHATLSKSCTAILDADDDMALEYACGTTNVLGAMANCILGDDYDETADIINESEEGFLAWWELALTLADAANPFDEGNESSSEQHPESSVMEEFNALDPLDRIEWLSQVLIDARLKPKEIGEEDRQSVEEYSLGFVPIYQLLVPSFCGDFYCEPFGAYSDDELRDFFPDLWRHAAKITQGEWVPEDMSVEVEADGDDSIITVRFSAFGETHEWLYRHDSSYADTSWFEDLHEFAEKFLDGRYVVDDGEISCGYAYLPESVINRLEL